MTWGDLERRIDTSDLSRRNRTVLKAFSVHVNRPTKARPYPINMLTWPGMETLMDLTHYSRDTIQAAKRELVQDGILEPVAPACRAQGGRGRAPRYRINEQKIQRDEVAWERQQQRRTLRQTGTHPVDPKPEKGRENTDSFAEKGRENADPFPEKGYAKCPPEFSSSTKDPEGFNFSREADRHTKKPVVAHTDDETPTKTMAPATLTFSDDVAQWAADTVPGLNLSWQRDKFLAYARAHKTRDAD
jgi:hypothetical protein